MVASSKPYTGSSCKRLARQLPGIIDPVSTASIAYCAVVSHCSGVFPLRSRMLSLGPGADLLGQWLGVSKVSFGDFGDSTVEAEREPSTSAEAFSAQELLRIPSPTGSVESNVMRPMDSS